MKPFNKMISGTSVLQYLDPDQSGCLSYTLNENMKLVDRFFRAAIIEAQKKASSRSELCCEGAKLLQEDADAFRLAQEP